MNLKKLVIISFATLIVLIVASCSEYQKMLKSTDANAKYNKAIEYYKEKDYFRSESLLDELLTVFKGTTRAEEVYYYYAYCYFGMEDFILAGYHFKTFVQTYPNSPHKEECEYMTAYCYYLNSPDPSLDQTYTFRAIDELQLFIERFPGSDSLKRVNDLIDKLRLKLETKSYKNSKLYYNMGDFKAAITAIRNTLLDYPDSPFREELMYLLLKSSFQLAEGSIEKKKKERYQLAVNEYYALKADYPDSKYLKDAEWIFGQSVSKLENKQ